MAIRSAKSLFSLGVFLIACLIGETSRAYAANPILEISIQNSPEDGVYIDTKLGSDITIVPPGSSWDLREAFFTPSHQGIYPGIDRDVYVTLRGNGFADFTVINKTGNAPINEIFELTVPTLMCLHLAADRRSFIFYGAQTSDKPLTPVAAIGNFTGQMGTGKRVPVTGVLAGIYAGMQKIMLRVDVPPSQIRFPLTTSFSYVTFFTSPREFDHLILKPVDPKLPAGPSLPVCGLPNSAIFKPKGSAKIPA